jgi:hypothetical protein
MNGSREPSLKGRLSTVDLLIKIACIAEKKNFRNKNSLSELVSKRRSIVLILPLE